MYKGCQCLFFTIPSLHPLFSISVIYNQKKHALPSNSILKRKCSFHYFTIFFTILCLAGHCSLATFREVFFVNKVHRKPENYGAKSCFA